MPVQLFSLTSSPHPTPYYPTTLQLVALSNRLLGKRFTAALLRPTFFAHFCAGETSEEVAHTIRFLQVQGVGGILDYAAEADVNQEGIAASRQTEESRWVDGVVVAGGWDDWCSERDARRYVSEGWLEESGCSENERKVCRESRERSR